MTRTVRGSRVLALAVTLSAALALGACKGDRGETDRTDRAVDRTSARADEAGDKVNEAWITAKIQAKYFGDADVKGRNIDVETSNGVVTLSGQVESEQAHQRALAIARETDGVTRVEDRLSVAAGSRPVATAGEGGTAGSGGAQPSDQDIQGHIQSQFFDRQAIRHSDIEVSASGGVVTLNGQAPSESVRQEALSIATATPGVQRVEDRLQVNPPPAPAGTSGTIAPVPQTPPPSASATPSSPGGGNDEWITTQIQARYFEDVLVKDALIEVTTAGGTVTLQGTVASEAGRQQALRIAREIQGVTQVEDKLTVRQ